MATYYDKEHKTWYCTFRYKSWDGVTRTTTKRGFKTKREATKFEVDFKATNLTVSSLAMKFLEDTKANKSRATYKAYSNVINTHIIPQMGNMPVEKIDRLTIKGWQTKLAQEDLSNPTLRLYNVVFSAMLNYAVKLYGLTENPFKVLGMQGKLTKREAFWEIEEFEKVSKLFKTKFDKAVYNLLFYSGVRIGELLALTLEDIDFDKNTIDINKTWDKGTGRFGKPKTTNSYRKIVIPQKTMDIVKDYVKSFLEPPDRVFGIRSYQAIYEKLQRYARKSDVPVITLHGLRHSHATLLIRKGFDPTTIAKRLGQSPTVLLQVYAHVYKDADKEIASALDNL